MSFDYHAVSGDYQYRALQSGKRMQRFWHAGKLSMVDQLLQPRIPVNAQLLEIGCGSGNACGSIFRASLGFPEAGGARGGNGQDQR